MSNVMDLIAQLPIDKSTKLIPMGELSSENVLHWRIFVQYLNEQNINDELEMVLPELSKFCSYIRDYLYMMSSKSFEKWEIRTQMFILLQLFEITKVFDLSDESGRKSLKDLVLDTLMTNHASPEIIKCIVQHLETIIPVIDNRVDSLIHVINEIRSPSSGETQTQTQTQEVCSADHRESNEIKV